MTPQQPHPQRCTLDEIDAISQFLDKYKDSELFFYSKKTIRRMVLGDDEGRKPYDIFLTKVQGQIVGIAIVSSKSKTLSLLFVSPEYRKNGIGKDLYNVANPKQILAKRKAIPYFAMLEGCASHSSTQAPELESIDSANVPGILKQALKDIASTAAAKARKEERERLLGEVIALLRGDP